MNPYGELTEREQHVLNFLKAKYCQQFSPAAWEAAEAASIYVLKYDAEVRARMSLPPLPPGFQPPPTIHQRMGLPPNPPPRQNDADDADWWKQESVVPRILGR